MQSQELTDEETEHLRDVFVSAFRTPHSLGEMVTTHLDSDFGLALAGQDLIDAIDRLIAKAKSAGRSRELIRAARRGNPLSFCLRAFEEHYRLSRSIQENVELPIELRRRLLNTLLAIPILHTAGARDALLVGLPPAGLSRNHSNAVIDLSNMVMSLAPVGRLASGDWPLLVFIANALFFARDQPKFEDELNSIAAMLATAYGTQWRP